MKVNTGILGLASKSTLFYIEELNRRYNAKHGGFSTYPFKLLNTDFDQINQQLPHYSDELHATVYQYLLQLTALNIDHILVPNITLHETIDIIISQESFPTPIIHPLKETVNTLKENNTQEIILFGTEYTMNSEYIKSYFNKNGIQVIKPSIEDMKNIDNIRREVYKDINLKKNVGAHNQLIEKYTKENNIVLACTELSMINPDTNPKVYDMASIQINKTLEAIHT